MSSVIRIGTVSKVNYEDGTIEVAYEDRDGSVTDEICVVSNALYRMPVVGARQPVYMVVEGGSDLEKATVQIPKLSGTPTIIYGGVEDD